MIDNVYLWFMNGKESASQRRIKELTAQVDQLTAQRESIVDQYNAKLKEVTEKLNRAQALVNFRSTSYQLLSKKSRFFWPLSRIKKWIEEAEKHVLAAYDANNE